MYISHERKVSSVKGAGIQYILGHEDNFSDIVIKNYVPLKDKVLDLGGGGLMLAIPAALAGRSVTVVDLDQGSMDVAAIADRVNKNGKFIVDAEKIRSRIKIVKDDILNYLRRASETYGLISAFRVIHFFDRAKIDKLFSLVRDRLDDQGIFAVSAMTIHNNRARGEFNEFYLNSSQINDGDILYREFLAGPESERIMGSQNLPARLHFVDNDFMDSRADAHGFEVIERDVLSTRVVNGYILRKR